jgi:hypothetical protein
VPGRVFESGLELARAEVNLLPGQKKTYVLTAAVLNAVHGGSYTLHFIPQSTLWAQLSKVTFDAKGWSVSGPTSALWYARGPASYHWKLSH